MELKIEIFALMSMLKVLICTKGNKTHNVLLHEFISTKLIETNNSSSSVILNSSTSSEETE